tara:strand:+ start:441 stop:737 length:297 start_codon:yes stop_codon:yes gene_type:complete
MIIEAILSINPNANVSVQGDNLENAIINWNDTPIIPNDELQAEINKLQAEYDAEEWKRNRKAEYPTHEDCIHALLDGGDTLTELQEKRQAIKKKYPKP